MFLIKWFNMDIYIRHVKIEDSQVSWKWRNDEEVWQYTFNRPNMIITPEIEKEWLENLLRNPYRKGFAICINDTNEYVGNSYLNDLDEQSAVFGIFIGNKNYWNRGIGTSATQLTLQYAYHNLNLNKVRLCVKEGNYRARAAYERSGFLIVEKKGEDISMEVDLNNKFASVRNHLDCRWGD